MSTKFIVTTCRYGTPKGVKIIGGESGFQLTGGVVEAKTEVSESGPMMITLTLIADEIQFVKETD